MYRYASRPNLIHTKKAQLRRNVNETYDVNEIQGRSTPKQLTFTIVDILTIGFGMDVTFKWQQLSMKFQTVESLTLYYDNNLGGDSISSI